jgi:hypothetical protein
MPANLSLTGTGFNCPKIAGVKKIWFIPTADIKLITLGTTAHDITDLEFVTSGNGFGEIAFKRGEAELTQTYERMNEVVVNFAVPNPTKEQLFSLQKIKDTCEMYAVVQTYDRDELFFVGYDKVATDEGFLTHQTAAATTGRAKADDNLTSVSLIAEQGEYVRVLSGISGTTPPSTTTAAIIAELLAATNV